MMTDGIVSWAGNLLAAHVQFFRSLASINMCPCCMTVGCPTATAVADVICLVLFGKWTDQCITTIGLQLE